MTRGFLPLLAAIVALGTTALAWGTDGFGAITSEGARRLAIEKAPPAISDAELIDQDGIRFSLRDYRGQPVLVEFIYTRCPNLCGVLGDDFRRVLASRPATMPRLLSISFDPVADDRAALQAYAERYGATAPRWRVAAPASGRGLARLLAAFGVVVIPDGFGGFIHNGGIEMVDANGRLARVLDPGAPAPLLAAAVSASGSGR